MKASSIIKLVCWTVVAVVLLCVLAAGLRGGWGGDWLRLELKGLGASDAQGFEGQAVQGTGSASGVGDIEINWYAGEIHIQEYDGQEVRFEQTADFDIPESRLLRYSVSGDTLALNEGEQRNFTSLHWSKSTDLTVYLPRDYALDELSVEAASARLSIDRLQAETLDIAAASGEIQLGEIRAAKLDVDSASGALRGENVVVDRVEANMVSGAVALAGSVGELDCDTVSGSVLLDSAICPSRVKVSSISGAVTLRIPENEGFTASLSSASGSLATDFPCTQSKGRAVYGNGAATFDVDSVSGSFNVTRR